MLQSACASAAAVLIAVSAVIASRVGFQESLASIGVLSATVVTTVSMLVIGIVSRKRPMLRRAFLSGSFSAAAVCAVVACREHGHPLWSFGGTIVMILVGLLLESGSIFRRCIALAVTSALTMWCIFYFERFNDKMLFAVIGLGVLTVMGVAWRNFVPRESSGLTDDFDGGSGAHLRLTFTYIE